MRPIRLFAACLLVGCGATNDDVVGDVASDNGGAVGAGGAPMNADGGGGAGTIGIASVGGSMISGGGNGGSTGIGVSDTGLAAGDYPFQLVATAGALSHSINAILRVGDFTASLDKNSATLSAGQSATFNVTLSSINHYTSTITIFCQPANQSVTCQNPSATLTDNGTVTLQLVISRPAGSAASSHAVAGAQEFPTYMCFYGLAAVLLVVRRRKPSLVLAAIVLSALTVSCGGGGSASNPGPSPAPTPSPTAQTVKVSVLAQSALVPSDSLNQKTLGQIAITLN